MATKIWKINEQRQNWQTRQYSNLQLKIQTAPQNGRCPLRVSLVRVVAAMPGSLTCVLHSLWLMSSTIEVEVNLVIGRDSRLSNRCDRPSFCWDATCMSENCMWVSCQEYLQATTHQKNPNAFRPVGLQKKPARVAVSHQHLLHVAPSLP